MVNVMPTTLQVQRQLAEALLVVKGWENDQVSEFLALAQNYIVD